MNDKLVNLQSGKLLPSIAVALCGAIWGTYWIPMRWFDSLGVGAGWVSVVFSAVCMIAPLPWLLNRTSWAGAGPALWTGLLLGTGFSLYTVSLLLTDVIHAILLFYLTPVWSTLAAWLLQGERLSPARILSIVCGFSGMALILGLSEGLPMPRNIGDWVALAAGMFWAWGTLRSFASPSASIALPVFSFSAGGLVSSLAILVLALPLGLPLASTGEFWTTLPWIILLALIVFVPPNVLVLWAAQRIDSGRVGILLMTEVLVGSTTAAMFSGESFTAQDAVGTALIVLAGFVEVLGRK